MLDEPELRLTIAFMRKPAEVRAPLSGRRARAALRSRRTHGASVRCPRGGAASYRSVMMLQGRGAMVRQPSRSEWSHIQALFVELLDPAPTRSDNRRVEQVCVTPCRSRCSSDP